jgi:hypothetical protein
MNKFNTKFFMYLCFGNDYLKQIVKNIPDTEKTIVWRLQI